MMKKIAAVSAALAIGALSQFALAQTTTPAPQTTPQTKPATPPATTTKPATTPATTPKTTTAKPKTTAAPSPCKGLEEAACGGKTECSWVKATVDKNKKPRKAYCRLKPAPKATAPKSTAPAKTTTAPTTTTPPATTTAPKVTPPPATTTTKPKTQ